MTTQESIQSSHALLADGSYPQCRKKDTQTLRATSGSANQLITGSRRHSLILLSHYKVVNHINQPPTQLKNDR